MADREQARLELERIEAAFKRAAYKAIHGTREERSGRFLPSKLETTPGTTRAKRPEKPPGEEDG